MNTQLVLVDPPQDTWKLDARTREVGRSGVAAARKALLEATARIAA